MRFAVLGGSLALETEGERPSEDALWLVWFARKRGVAGCVVDAGCGLGIVGLALLSAGVCERVVGVDVTPARVDEAARNARLNGVEGSYEAVLASVEDFVPSFPVDAVVCNPPFYPLEAGHGQGEKRPPEQVVAKVADAGLLGRWLVCFMRWLVPGGRVFLVVHAAWVAELECLAAGLGVRVVVVPLATHPVRAPKRLLVEIVKSEVGVVWETPVAAYEAGVRREALGG